MPTGIYKRVGKKFLGLSRTKVYKVWAGMKDRCNNPKNNFYKNYGGRGIKYTRKWENFWGFFEDVGKNHKEGLTLDRIDNNKGYNKENCRWITRKEQLLNTRRNVLISFRGKTQPLKLWADRLGIGHETMRMRLKKWSITRALTEKSNEKNKNLLACTSKRRYGKK